MSLQQSAPIAHGAPADAHAGASPQVAVPSSRATHASEQHAAANVHDDPAPKHPTAGAQVGAGPPSAHHPEQHCAEVVHGAWSTLPEHPAPSPVGVSAGASSAGRESAPEVASALASPASVRLDAGSSTSSEAGAHDPAIPSAAASGASPAVARTRARARTMLRE